MSTHQTQTAGLAPPGRFGDAPRGVNLDAAAGSRVLAACLQRADAFARRCRAQLGGPYHESRLAGRALARSRRRLARFLNLPDGGQLHAAGSVTAALERLSRALAPAFRPGDTVVVTAADHEANITPWLRLAERGVNIRWWRPALPGGRLEPDELDGLLAPGTRLLCLTHCSNVTGAITPLAHIVERAHRAGVAVCADGTAYAPHRSVDLASLGVDFYALSLFKCFGPQLALLAAAPGAGIPPGRKDGAGLDDGAFAYASLYAATAVPDHVAALAGESPASASPGYRAAIEAGYRAIAKHETDLLAGLAPVLARHGLRPVGPPLDRNEQRVPIVAVTGPHIERLAPALARHGIGVRYGRFRATRLLQALGHDGLLRISLAHYHGRDDIERLDRALARVRLRDPRRA
ncbi:MAG TPA: aminotransferase class V-fold PLP-dependent enzyme [Gammaproteobacteria bacterium]|nr:aminotransferase class V-fold PLP-dependent enzyme [Gammaproteobacteria bacterium]